MKKNPLSGPARRSVLRNRLRVYAAIGLAVVAAWLYYTVNAVLAIYDVALAIERNTGLRQRVVDAQAGLREADDALDRYLASGEGYDLARHRSARTATRAALGAIRQRRLTEGASGSFDRAIGAEELYSKNADRAIAAWKPDGPAEALTIRDGFVRPAAEKLRDFLTDLEARFGRGETIAEEHLSNARDAAATAIGLLAVLILTAIFWFLADVNRRIVSPLSAAGRALEDLAEGHTPPRLSEQADDETGRLAAQVNRFAAISEERARELEERDIESSVNAILTVAATVNDLKGFGAATMQKIVEVAGAATGVLYLPSSGEGFAPVVSVGGDGGGQVGSEEAARAARERRPLFQTIDPKTPTVNLFDGRILPRETAHIPLVHSDRVAAVLALAATESFAPKTRNALIAIAPSLAVAVANAVANERVAEQSRRLAEQNELLEDQRARIERTASELQHAGELKDRFLASVSHELRTPMTVILGFTAALLRETQGPLTAGQKESLERVQRNARLLLGLINDILDISKIESGKAELDLESISIPAFLAQIEADYRDAARRKGLTLASKTAAGLDRITTDPAKLTQILTNLIGNALKFTESGGIRILAESAPGDRWSLAVADTGIGIPESEHGTIFDEFRQGESPDHHGRGGTGLGLAIVRKLARFLGGTVTVQSAPGHGSRFTVTLPRELAAAPRGREEPAPRRGAEPATAGDRTVLIVDDDESIRRLLALELEPYGVRVIEAGDAGECIQIAREVKPDVILLDVLMPGVNGWDALRALKESPETRGIPVIVLSVVENRAYGLALGAVDYLIKPLGRSELLGALTRAGVLSSPKSARESA
jgi:signal transduction histidine kinase/ActR/RegA family two-component response regulator